MTPSRRNLTAHLLLLAVVLVWGTTFSLVKAALNDVSPLLFNVLRMALAFVVLAAVNAPALRGVTRMEAGLSALAGIFLALGYQLQTVGLVHTTPAKAAFITGLVVVLVPLLAAIPGVAAPGSTAASFATWLGAALALAGLLLLTTPPGSAAGLFDGLGLGEMLCLGCALAFAAHLLVLSRVAPRVSARRLGTLQIGFAALLMLLTLPFGGHQRLHPTPVVWIALAVTAVLATAAAFTIQSWAQQLLPASHVALLFTLEPVFAWLTSLFFMGEHLGTRGATGAALILGGLLIVELSPIPRTGRAA